MAGGGSSRPLVSGARAPYISRMDASAAARNPGPSVRARARSIPGDLQLAILVLAFCLLDAGVSLAGESTGPAFDRLPRLLQLLLASLLLIVPGALAARLAFPRFPASNRECLGIVAVFVLGSAVSHRLTFVFIPVNPGTQTDFFRDLPLIVQSVLSYALAAIGIVYAMYWWRRDTTIQQELHRTRVGLLKLKADRADAELLRLRAQIEPHFLFNTLATIMQLYQSDTAAANRTLALLIDYMNASRVHMRHHETVMAQELALAEGYLAIQCLRMGERLHHVIEVPAEVRGSRIPPASLLTLIENAVKHGLAPVAGGGMLSVTAHKDGGWLVVSVSDNGVGFRVTSGRGLGLANLRARLHGLYGEGASLRLTSVEAGGVVATLRLPFGPPVDAVAS